MTGSREAFIESIECQMGIEPKARHSVAEIVAGSNAGHFEIRGDKGVFIERATSMMMASVGAHGATARDVERCEFAKYGT